MFIKRSYLILIGILIIVLFSLLLGKFLWQDKPQSIKKDATVLDSIKKNIVKDEPRETKQIYTGKVIPSVQKNISFNVSGKLEKGDLVLKEGTYFKANQLLYKLNLKDAFNAISTKKIALAKKITEALTELPDDLSNETSKWEKFTNDVTPAKRLPELPNFNSKKEILFFSEKRILGDYKEISNMEKDIENYFYLAPFDGYVVEVYVKPGSDTKAGKSVARIAKKNSFELKVTVPKEQSELFEIGQKVDLLNIEKDTIGGGELMRKSVEKEFNPSTVDLYFSVRANKGEKISSGLELTIEKL